MPQPNVTTVLITNADGRSADAELTHEGAYDLAQLLKRLTWTELRACAKDDDEAFSMRASVNKLQDALARAGYAPR